MFWRGQDEHMFLIVYMPVWLPCICKMPQVSENWQLYIFSRMIRRLLSSALIECSKGSFRPNVRVCDTSLTRKINSTGAGHSDEGSPHSWRTYIIFYEVCCATALHNRPGASRCNVWGEACPTWSLGYPHITGRLDIELRKDEVCHTYKPKIATWMNPFFKQYSGDQIEDVDIIFVFGSVYSHYINKGC